MKLTMVSCCLLIGTLPAISQSQKAKDLVAQMSREEKINLVVGMGMNIPGVNLGSGTGVGQTMDKVPGAAGTTYAITRLGLPNTVVADGPAGLRINPTRDKDTKTYYATAWPVATLLASSWDTSLVKQVGEGMGNEVKEYGVDVLLGPGMNIQRNPLGGRNFEYYSEDPLVTGKIAAAMVNGIQKNGSGVSIKHFAANNHEKNRNTIDVVMSERALREIYLKGFQIVVKEANPMTVMSSYNKLNGTYTSQSYPLLTTILREEWGFKGMVMTDWFGGKDAVEQMKAGNDLLMPGTKEQKKAIDEALTAGKLDMAIVDQNAARVVDYILRTSSYAKYAFGNSPDLKAHALLARRAAAEGMVLLKNEAASLPIAAHAKNIAAFGITSYDFVSGGTGSGDVNEAYTVSLVEGLQNAGYKLEPMLTSAYSEYVKAEKAKQPKKNFFEEFMNPTPRIPEMPLTDEMIEAKAAVTDIALLTIGRNAGEGSDRKVENDFNLKESERELIEKVSRIYHAKGKKLVVIINAGGVIETASWRDKADAILLAWQPGLEAGNAVADILSGKVNPSGKLAVTFPVNYEDDITAAGFPGKEFPEGATVGNFGMKQIPAEIIYNEGIYVGYRYFNAAGIRPAYPFGFGLSYTHFGYNSLKLSSSVLNGQVTVSITVTNTGAVAGKEVVQLYVSAPAKTLHKPKEELRSFAKTKLLQPGESQTLQFRISAADLASFDSHRSAWVAEAGSYQLKVGASSADFRHQATLTLPAEIITEKCNSVLSPAAPVGEWQLKRPVATDTN